MTLVTLLHFILFYYLMHHIVLKQLYQAQSYQIQWLLHYSSTSLYSKCEMITEVFPTSLPDAVFFWLAIMQCSHFLRCVCPGQPWKWRGGWVAVYITSLQVKVRKNKRAGSRQKEVKLTSTTGCLTEHDKKQEPDRVFMLSQREL